MTESTPVVEMRNIKKNFGGVQALRGVDLILRKNEVLGLVGDNAAGKSTSVSYTHLDVYKRQAARSAIAIPIISARFSRNIPA